MLVAIRQGQKEEERMFDEGGLGAATMRSLQIFHIKDVQKRRVNHQKVNMANSGKLA